jgi:hypothetical protein
MLKLRFHWLATLAVCGLSLGLPLGSRAQDKKEASVKSALVKAQEVKENSDTLLYLSAVRALSKDHTEDTWALIADQGVAQWTGAYGLNVTQADETLRRQLQIPTDDAMVIVGFAQPGQEEKLSLRLHDVLVGVGKNPDATKPLRLTVYRQGKAQKLELPAASPPKKLWIGVDMEAIEEKAPLRSQLKLPASAGLLLTHIYENSPAEKAGLKVHDVVYEVAGKPLSTTDDLAQAVQKSEQKPMGLLLLRQATPMTILVTPQIRPQPVENKDAGHLATTLNRYLTLSNAQVVDARGKVSYSFTPQYRVASGTILTDVQLALQPSAVEQLEALQRDLAALQQQSAAIQQKIASVLKQVKEEKK